MRAEQEREILVLGAFVQAKQENDILVLMVYLRRSVFWIHIAYVQEEQASEILVVAYGQAEQAYEMLGLIPHVQAEQ